MLTAETSSISDTDGMGTFSYKWIRDGSDISAPNSSTYLLESDSEIGSSISVRVSYTDGYGTVESLTSSATSAVQDVILNAKSPFTLTEAGDLHWGITYEVSSPVPGINNYQEILSEQMFGELRSKVGLVLTPVVTAQQQLLFYHYPTI
jgi:hypothetical protein